MTTPRTRYVLGGPLDPELERRKAEGLQPLAEFNVFARRNGAEILGTEGGRIGRPTSLPRRLALARHVVAHAAGHDRLVASGEDIGIPLALAMRAAPNRRRPLGIVLHGSYLAGARFRLLAPILRRAPETSFLCLSAALRDRMVDIHGFPAERCHDAGYGVDTVFFRPTPVPNSRLVLAAGQANRDYATLIAAMRGRNAELRIAADSLWRPRRDRSPGTPLPADVTLASAGDYPALRELYRAARFVVVPLHPATFASGYAVIVEAMASGRAVIATRTGADSGLIVDGRTGFLVPPHDPRALAERIGQLLDDPALAADLGAAAAERIATQYSLEAYCARMEEILASASRYP